MYIRKVVTRHRCCGAGVGSQIAVRVLVALCAIVAIPHVAYAAVPAGTINPSCGPLDTSCVVVTDSYDAGIIIGTSTPTSTLGRLYSSNGYLYWSGALLATASSGIFQLNGLFSSTQSFAVGISGNDFGIVSSGTVHTFNLPDASSVARGLVSTSTQSFIGAKTFTGSLSVQGTTTLSSVLNLSSLSGGLLVTNASGTVATSSIGTLGGFVNGGNVFSGLATLGTSNSNALRFIASSTEAMRIIQGGFVGVGLTSPTALLSVGTSDAVPYINMSNNTTPAPYRASASSELAIDYQAFKAFDNQLETAWIIQERFSTSTGAWVAFDYAATYYADGAEILSTTNESPTDWRIEGSNDNSTWSTLYEQHAALSSINTVVTFTNPGAYRYYRLFIIAANYDFPKINNFKITSSVSSGLSAKFNGAIFAPEARLLTGGLMLASSTPTTTANVLYNQAGALRWNGQSFLTASESTAPTFAMSSNSAPAPYKASASTENDASVLAWKAFDGDDTTFWMATAGTVSNYWLKIDLGAQYYSDGAVVEGRNNPSSQPVNWRIEGSIDDVAWEALYAEAGTMSTSSTAINLSNPGTYRYYRMFSVSSNGTAPGMDTFRITSSVPNGVYSIFKKNIAAPGLLAQRNGITISSSSPSSTTSTLYSLGSSLYWNGALLATASSGIFQLNGLSSSTQSFAVVTSGNDFGIVSSGTVHTFNLPDASSVARGLMSTSTQSFIGAKTFNGALTVNNNLIATGTLTAQGTTTLSSALNLGALSGGLLVTNASGVVATTSISAQGGFVNGGNAFGGLATLGTLDSQPLRFYASSTEVIRILASGNVGIGTSTPVGKLAVSGGGLSAESLVLAQSYGSIAQPFVGHAGYTNFSGGLGTGAVNSSAPYLRLTSTGNLVNIGSIQGGELNLTGGGTLAAKVDYTVGVYPISTSVGDLNGDNKADMAVANYGSNTVSVFINNGNGTFAPKVDYITGANPNSVAMGDLNGDGKADMAVTGSVNFISVFINNGNGTFAPKVDYARSGGTSSSVSIGDLNGDGKADLVAPTPAFGTASVLMNNGNGTFAASVEYGINPNPNSVAIGDLNGDGKADMAATSLPAATVSVLVNNGNGTFAPRVDYATGASPLMVTLGDLNGDSASDMVVINNGTTTISVFMNNGDGTFASKVDYTVGTGPISASISDISGDGKPDVVVVVQGINTVSVLANNGNGTLAAKVDYVTGATPHGNAIGDFNGDGKADVVVTNFGTTTVSVFMNNTTPLLLAQASTGNVGVGTSSPARKLHVKTSADEPPVRFEDSNGYCEINPLSTTWSCTSDARLKTNVIQMSSALEGVLGLKPVNFDWKARATTTEGGRGEQFGLIAQDVESIFPHLVTTDAKTGIKSVAYGGLSVLALKAMQEQYGGIMGVDIAHTQDKASLFSSTTTLVGLESGGVARETIANVVQYVRDRVSDGIKIARTIVTEQIVAVHAVFDTLLARRATVEVLCVQNTGGETCIARDQLNALLSGAGVSQISSVVQVGSSNPSANVATSSASTTSSAPSVPPSVIEPVVEIEQVDIIKNQSSSAVDSSTEAERAATQ